jgi:hypothetical protein
MTRHTYLDRGIAAAKAGDKATARRHLTQAVRRDPESVAAWLWLSSVLDTPQGRAFCLRRAVALDPDNSAAKKGLSALETAPPAQALVAQPPPTTPARPTEGLLPTPGPPARRPSLSGTLVRQTQFWKVIVACLAVIALGLVGTLTYAAFSGSSAAEDEVLAAVVPEQSPWPGGTLRPTYTATLTETPMPTDMAARTFTPTDMAARTFTPTETPTHPPLPTDTPIPTPKPRPRRQSPTVAPTPTPVPRPTPRPRWLDPRLPQLRVHVEPASVSPGQPYWRLVEVRWTNERESAGKHSIYVEVLSSQGSRAVEQPVIVQWAGSNISLPVEDVPPPDWGVNFPMYNTLGSYAVHVGGAPSDRVVGLGLGTPETPNFTVHTSFYLTFCLSYR